MADIDRRAAGHTAGLRRLSNRAASGAPTAGACASSRSGLQSFLPLAEAIISHLRASGVHILPGLSDSEFVRIEATLEFCFPPDLRAVLSLGLPSGPGFPDWRSTSRLHAFIDIPIAAVSLQIARGAFWPKCWGPPPSGPHCDLPTVQSFLHRAPLLIPLFGHSYIPCRPSLAGNPIFFVDELCVLCCGFDLPDFFRRDTSFRSPNRSLRRQKSASAATDKLPLYAPPPHSTRRSLDSIAGKPPRWIEFWSDTILERRRRNLLSSPSNHHIPDAPPEIHPAKLLTGVGTYLDRIGSVLRKGGWEESDVSEMIELSSSVSSRYSCPGMVDGEAVLHSLHLNADRCPNSMRRAGWSSEEISEAFCFDFRRERLPAQKLSPKIGSKIAKLVEPVSRF